MSRYMANEPQSTFFMDVLKIALGVFIGGLLAALAYTKIIAMGVEQAAAQASAAMKRDMQKMNAQQEQQRREQEARSRAEQAAARAQAEEKARITQQRHIENQERIAFEARREAAWKRTFRPSQLCQDDPLTTECIDTANISRRRFYAQYRE